MDAQLYATNVTDAEWDLLRPLLERTSRRGRPRRHPVRVVVNAILYALRTGCA
ncbi:MAG TPA: transposase [Ktedonobacterales bacterium]|nr:transposase [Ktedonobacterales bacterium]